MFKENSKHLQSSFLETTYWMNQGIKKKLEKSWAPAFYRLVFQKIDELPFSKLYSNIGSPNFPINILLSLEFIKYIMDFSDHELINAFYFNYLVNYAVGIRTIGEINLSEKTLYNFRGRVYQHLLANPDDEEAIFGQFYTLASAFIKSPGVASSMTELTVVNATQFITNIRDYGVLSLLFNRLEKSIKNIPEEKRGEELQIVLKKGFKTKILYRTRPSQLDEISRMLRELLKKVT